MATVHSYVRFSTPEQAEGDSERRQLEKAKEWCNKHGHRLSNLCLVDRGKSGFKGNRQKALSRFLSEIGKRVQPGDILLVEAVDRLSRKGIRPTQDLVNSILNKGVHIGLYFPVDKVYRADDQNDIGGAIELAAFAFQAFMYSKLLSDRITSWWDEARKNATEHGKPFAKHRPGWLDWDDESKQYTIKAGMQRAIEFIFRRVVDGLGEKKLLTELAAKGYTSWGRSGKWNSTLIGKLLRDPAVIGVWQPMHLEKAKLVPGGEAIPDFYPRLISDALFHQAQAERRTRYQGRGPNGDFVNVLSKLTYCKLDGHPYHISTIMPNKKTVARRLVSYGHMRRLAGACKLSMNYPVVEAYVLAAMYELTPADLQPSTPDQAANIHDRQQELSGIQARLDELTDELATPKIGRPVPQIGLAIDRLNADRARVVAEIEKLKQVSAQQELKPLEEFQSIMSYIAGVTGKEEQKELRLKLRALVCAMVERIDITPFKSGHNVGGEIEIRLTCGKCRKLLLTGKRMGPLDERAEIVRRTFLS